MDLLAEVEDKVFKEEMNIIDNLFWKYKETKGITLNVGITDEICLSNDSSAMSYAENAPEWFDKFINFTSGYTAPRDAFRNRDKSGALNAVAKHIKKFDEKDRKLILGTFEKYWQALGVGIPVLLIANIPCDRVYKEEMFDDPDELLIRELLYGRVNQAGEVRVKRVPKQNIIVAPLVSGYGKEDELKGGIFNHE